MPEYPRKFIHKGEDHMSFKGYFVTAKTFYYHKQNNMPVEAIFMEHGTSFDTIFDAQGQRRERQLRAFPPIRTMQEHYEYILKNFVEFEEAAKLREKMKGRTDEEIIKMMPMAFAWVLSIHLLQQKRRGGGSVKPTAPEPKKNLIDFDDESDALDLL